MQCGVGLFLNARGFVRRVPRMWHLFQAESVIPHPIRWMAGGISLMELIVVVAFVLGGYLMLRRDSRTPRYWPYALCAAYVANVVGLMLILVEHRVNIEAGRLTPEPQIARYQLGVLFGVVPTLIWSLYWTRAKRVIEAFAPRPSNSSVSDAVAA